MTRTTRALAATFVATFRAALYASARFPCIVAAYHSIKPNRAVVPHRHLPHHHGGFSQVTIFSKSRLEASYFLHYGHAKLSIKVLTSN